VKKATNTVFLVSAILALVVLSALVFKPFFVGVVEGVYKETTDMVGEALGQHVDATRFEETLDVPVTVRATQSVSLSFPDSDYTSHFSLDLGADFVDQTDPTWWNRVMKEVEQLHCEERGLCPEKYFSYQIIVNGDDDQKTVYNIKSIPTVEWLADNVKVYAKKPFTYVMIDLPESGEMREVIDEAGYEKYLDSYRYDADELAKVPQMQLHVGESRIYSAWHIFDYPEDDHRYFMETLEDIQDLPMKSLMYSFGDGRYLVLNIPDELQNLTAEQLLEGDKTFTISAEVYKAE